MLRWSVRPTVPVARVALTRVALRGMADDAPGRKSRGIEKTKSAKEEEEVPIYELKKPENPDGAGKPTRSRSPDATETKAPTTPVELKGVTLPKPPRRRTIRARKAATAAARMTAAKDATKKPVALRSATLADLMPSKPLPEVDEALEKPVLVGSPVSAVPAAVEVDTEPTRRLPLFMVPDPLFPNQKTKFRMWMPVHRSMVANLINGKHGGKTFGVVVSDGYVLNQRASAKIASTMNGMISGSPMEVGTEVDITNTTLNSDGSYLIEVEGKRRFNIRRAFEASNGAIIGRVKDIVETSPGVPGEIMYDLAMKQMESVADKLWTLAVEVFAQHGQWYQAQGFPRINTIVPYKIRKTPEDYEKFSMWVCANLPIRNTSYKYQMLALDSSVKRLQSLHNVYQNIARTLRRD